MFAPLLGHPTFDGASLKTGDPQPVYDITLDWIRRSAAAGHKWIVTSDESNHPSKGVVPDDIDPTHDIIRKYALWGNIMAGGA